MFEAAFSQFAFLVLCFELGVFSRRPIAIFFGMSLSVNIHLFNLLFKIECF